jgi:hypothetical protein
LIAKSKSAEITSLLDSGASKKIFLLRDTPLVAKLGGHAAPVLKVNSFRLVRLCLNSLAEKPLMTRGSQMPPG